MKTMDPANLDQNLLNRKYTPTPFAAGKSICSICNRPILEEHLPQDRREAEYVMKWKVHKECRDSLLNMLDRIADPGRKH